MKWKQWTAVVVLAGTAVAVQAQSVNPATLANTGGDGLAACASCHGAQGEGQGAMPRLAGINAAYLRKQLDDWRRAGASMR